MNSLEKSAKSNINCGFISLSLDHSLNKGEIIVHCTLCKEKFKRFGEYRSHVTAQHYPVIILEGCNVNIKEENVVFSTNNKTQNLNSLNKSDDSTFDFISSLLSQNDTGILEMGALLHDNTNDKKSSNDFIAANNVNNSDYEIASKSVNQCPHCDRNFYLLSSLRCHLIKHSKGYNYNCNLCNLDFEHSLALMAHMRKHERIKEKNNCTNSKKFKCKKMPKTFGGKAKEFNINVSACGLAIIASITDKPSEELEEENTLEEDNLKKPADFINSGKTKKSNNDENVIAVVQEENLQNKKFHHCPICNKALNKQKARFQATYNAHMRRHAACQFKCSICLKEFKTKGELQTHTRFHTGERPYLCSLCGESFYTASKLCNHSRRHHTKERKKQCNICKKEFYVLGELKTHYRTVHTNDRPYSCKLCPSTFNRRFSLRTHMKAHENKREHKCDLCSASFNQKCNLTAHKKKIHFLVTDNNEKGE